jgi:hypothetical protein
MIEAAEFFKMSARLNEDETLADNFVIFDLALKQTSDLPKHK